MIGSFPTVATQSLWQFLKLFVLLFLTFDDENASFAVLASIGLQGIRLAKPTLGETFLVSGLGLIGLLTAQLLVSHGCRVLGLDLIQRSVLAEELGVSFSSSKNSDPVAWCTQLTDGVGVDGVLIACHLVQRSSACCGSSLSPAWSDRSGRGHWVGSAS